MAARSILTTCCLLAIACSASEDANDAVRCAPDLSCPQQHVCYRGFCVEGPAQSEDASTGTSVPDPKASPSAEPTIAPVDAGSAPSTPGADGGTTTSGGSPNARPAPAEMSATTASGPLTGGSASVPVTSANAQPVASATQPVAPAHAQPAIPASPAPTSSVPASTDAGGVSEMPATQPPSSPALPEDAGTSSPVQVCIQTCALSSKDKACEQCFEELYGDKPNKLCAEAGKADTKDSSALTVCAAFCAVAPEGPFGCKDARVCHGAECGSD